MSDGRRKEIIHHIPETELDEQLAEAGDGEMVRRLGFVKNLYRGDTVAEAANRVGRSEATGDRWADAWNDAGIEGLAPSYGGGRPPKLDQDERRRLEELLREDGPWTRQEMRRLIEDEFGVEYHPDYLGTFVRKLGFEGPIGRHSRREDAGEDPETDGTGDAQDATDEARQDG